MDEIQQAYELFTQTVAVSLASMKHEIEAEREQLAVERKDKLLLDQKEAELQQKAAEMAQTQRDNELTIEKLREKTTLLDAREKRIEQERARLQELVNTF